MVTAQTRCRLHSTQVTEPLRNLLARGRESFAQRRAAAALDAESAAPLLGGHRTCVGLGDRPRETRVLRLIANGRTIRAITEEPAISEQTIARHIANIFAKLDLTSSAAATAYVFQHRVM